MEMSIVETSAVTCLLMSGHFSKFQIEEINLMGVGVASSVSGVRLF